MFSVARNGTVYVYSKSRNAVVSLVKFQIMPLKLPKTLLAMSPKTHKGDTQPFPRVPEGVKYHFILVDALHFSIGNSDLWLFYVYEVHFVVA